LPMARRVDIGELDLCARDDTAAGIANAADYLGCRGLTETMNGKTKCQ
jgi:hypothetical protein